MALAALWLLAMTAAPSFDAAQTAYVECLSSQVDAAIVARVTPATFVDSAPRACPEETAAYRHVAIRARSDAARFDDADRANRAAMIDRFNARAQRRHARIETDFSSE